MRKFMKTIALSLAMAMVFGMTVSAAPSPDKGSSAIIAEDAKEDVKDAPAEIKAEEVAEPTGEEKVAAENTAKEMGKNVAASDSKSDSLVLKKANGETVEVKIIVSKGDVTVNSLAPVAVKQVEKVVANVKTALKDALADADKKVEAVKAVAGADVSVDKTAAIAALAADAGISTEEAAAFIAEQGVTLTVDTGVTVEAGKSYLLYHLRADGVWENIPYTNLTADGKFTATFKSLSPITVLEVTTSEKDGDDGDDADDKTAGTSAEGSAVSPKTGESLPVAGVMAVICLAGLAVVAARKERFNN